MVSMARSMMKAKGMLTRLWGEAVTTMVFILNRAPTKALKGKMPFEAWHGRKPSVSFLQTFGPDIRLHRPRQEDEADPHQARGQEHTDGVPGLRGGYQGIPAL